MNSRPLLVFTLFMFVFSLGEVCAQTNIRSYRDVCRKMNRKGESYVIHGSVDLCGNTCRIPAESTLNVMSGSFINGSLVFDETSVIANKGRTAFNLDVSGSITNAQLYPEWFSDGTDDYTKAIQRAIDVGSSSNSRIVFSQKEYRIRGGQLILHSNTHLFSDSSSRLYTRDLNNYKSIFFQDLREFVHNVTIDGLFIDQSCESKGRVSTPVQLFVLLLYKAADVLVQNCRIIHVGTNALVINGDECSNTRIRFNEIEFVSIEKQGHYDVSSIYITDLDHDVSNNHIYNDGVICNRQGCGIETHGPIGKIYNNLIENCYNAINVVGYSPISDKWNESYDKVISDNVSSNCENFVVFWPLSETTIDKVLISNNNAHLCKKAIGVQPGVDYCGEMKEIVVSNNLFEGYKTIFTNELSTASNMHLFRYEAISLQNYGPIDISISDNVFHDFPAIILDVNVYSKKVYSEVKFYNNSLLNCFNSTINEPLTLKDRFSLFVVGPNSDVMIENNTIGVSTIDKSITPILLFTNGETRITLKNNFFNGTKISKMNLSSQTKVLL